MTLIAFLCLFVLPVAGQDSNMQYPKSLLSGQWRTYYMATVNKGSLKDFNALATGGYVRYEYRIAKSLRIGGALYNSTNLGIQDLQIADPQTGRLSRYEEGLFDRLDLANDVVIILGELYAYLALADHDFRLGRMKINSPLINPQDGRMIPSLVQGLWYRYRPEPGRQLQLGVINRMAPRSTVEFLKIGESIGPYPAGRGVDGGPARYPGNTDSGYVVLFNADVEITPAVRVNLWNQYTDNISNSFYLQPTLELSPTIQLQGEWLHQNRVGEGGNSIDSLRYFTPVHSDILGARIRYMEGTSGISLSYTRILPGGMFLSPREWGREDLFSFQKRERSEGTADSHAVVASYQRVFGEEKLKVRSIASLGHHWKPDIGNASLNKYAMPDYTHANLDLFFDLAALPNLKPELLLTAKFSDHRNMGVPEVFINKVGLFHLSLVLNYNF
ncbi:hypothetical protein H7F20_14590 [Robiginitalea sp. SC105]|nr:hypothetical protein [Robiginitalea sp. SC105]